MELKIGMYVSTTNRKEIGKITHFCECEYCKERGYLKPVIDNPNIFITIYDKENKFHGYKFYDTLMDLIQAGDYVNGKKVYSLGLAIGILNTINFEDGTFIVAEDIKTIVTKEKFEAMQYEVK